jgi:hypothetical protein
MNTETKQAHDLHRKFAVDLFNQTWDLLDTPDRTPDQDDTMIHAAHASRYHWGQVGTPVEFERGEWQISRVYSVLNHPEAALYHARRCLDICQANEIRDFDLAFAYEALARAYAVAGEQKKSGEYIELAMKAAEEIEDKENREYLEGELMTISACADSCTL